ncbi:hypothetical protein O3P69_007002 [Scylla paramamosain]|uniref:Alpha-1,3-mannosyl-glycoprotein 2-beta-N-acetylglucosaminyltransferase n=1 Tax=Scylla paramamosain TaxID=85552 RepID=A0AAW0V3T8_SCYPA
MHPDLSDIEVPLKERKFKGYFLIGRHYRWALNQMFQKFEYEAVIIVEGRLAAGREISERGGVGCGGSLVGCGGNKGEASCGGNAMQRQCLCWGHTSAAGD